MTGEQALYGRNKWLICLYMYYYLTKCRKSNEWLEHVPKALNCSIRIQINLLHSLTQLNYAG